MVRKKVELKTKYKQLVRKGKLKEAQEVLEEYWKLCGIVKETKPIKIEKKKYSREELEKKSFSELREIGYKVGTKGRGKEELVREILTLQ